MNHNLPRKKWTLDDITKEAKKHVSMAQWRESHPASYRAAVNRGLQHQIGNAAGLEPFKKPRS